MYTPMQYVLQINQPRGGFIPLSLFDVIERSDNIDLNYDSYLYGYVIAINTIKMITRYIITRDEVQSFSEAIAGADLLKERNQCKIHINEAVRSLNGNKKFHRVNYKGITEVTKLAIYATIFETHEPHKNRNTMLKNPYKGFVFSYNDKEIIKKLVDRILSFLDEQEIIAANVRFDNAYTGLISKGTTDFLTPSGIIDLHIGSAPPNINQTLSSFINMRLMSRSKYHVLLANHQIKIFNPCLNKVYMLNVDRMPVMRIFDVDRLIEGG